MKKVLLFVFLVIIWFVLLFPKNILWNNFKVIMNENGVQFVTKETRDEKIRFVLKNSTVFFNQLQVGTIKNIDIKPWIFYNEIDMDGFRVSEKVPFLKNFRIKKLVARYTVLNPKKVIFDGNSSYGNFDGEIKLFEKSGYILLKSHKLKDALLKDYFKNSKEGMKYEFSY